MKLLIPFILLTYCITVFYISTLSVMADVEVLEADAYRKLDRVEFRLYGKLYNDNNIKNRLERLEKSLNKGLREENLQKRIDTLYNTVFPQERLAGPSVLDRKNIILLDLIEDHLFSQSFPNDHERKRVERVEKIIFGKEKQGDLYERFKEISKIIPLSNVRSFKVSDFRGETQLNKKAP